MRPQQPVCAPLGRRRASSGTTPAGKQSRTHDSALSRDRRGARARLPAARRRPKFARRPAQGGSTRAHSERRQAEFSRGRVFSRALSSDPCVEPRQPAQCSQRREPRRERCAQNLGPVHATNARPGLSRDVQRGRSNAAPRALGNRRRESPEPRPLPAATVRLAPCSSDDEGLAHHERRPRLPPVTFLVDARQQAHRVQRLGFVVLRAGQEPGR